MAEKLYKCTNYFNCSFADEEGKTFKESELEEIDGVFVCPKCKKPVEEVVSKKPLPLGLIAGIAAGVIALGAGGFFLFGNKDKEAKKPAAPVVVEEPVGEEPEVIEKPVVVEEPVAQPEPAKPVKTQPSQPSYPTVGNFSGQKKNGFPHGQGTLTFTQKRLIDTHDEKSRMAEVGDYIIGEWDNGHLIQGKWYDAQNNPKGSITIGKAMNPDADHTLGKVK